MKKQILTKFNHIGALDHNLVIEKLEKLNSISLKLDCLKRLKKRYYDKYVNVFSKLSEDEKRYIDNNDQFVLKAIFGPYKLVPSLFVQEPVFNKYFSNWKSNPEISYWFLKYNAEILFKEKLEELKEDLASGFKETNIKAELLTIKNIEEEAKKLRLKKEIDIYQDYRTGNGAMWAFNKNILYIEVLRILDGNFYKKYSTNTLDITEKAAKIYADHIHLKPYLESLLKSKVVAKNIFHNNFSQKQIAIAYCVMDIHITIDNYLDILKKHSLTRSKKILQKQVYKKNDLLLLADNKTTDSKHLNDLNQAKWLLMGINNEKAVNDIGFIIRTFKNSFDKKY